MTVNGSINYHDICSFCLPLFLSDNLITQGHHERIENATATFITFNRSIYLVTCGHVLDHLQSIRPENGDWATMYLSVGRSILQFSFLDPNNPIKRKDSFQKTEIVDLFRPAPDIAIAKMPAHWWDWIQKEKNKLAINLDLWVEPLWNESSMGAAAGYPTEHKGLNQGKVSSPCVETVAEWASSLSINSDRFRMHSTLTEEHGIFFSGMSGGPVFLVDNNEDCHPIGIIIEGFPGSRAAFEERDGSSAFLSKLDIDIQGLLITPTRFSQWLEGIHP